MSRLLIRNGHLVDLANGLDQQGDLAIVDGHILAVGQVPAEFHPEEILDASGKLVIPGLIDLCARLREPGQEHKATIASETRAAALAGITTLVVPPDTDPVIDEPAVVNLIRRRAGAAGFSRVLSLGALTQGLAGEQLAEMAALRESGCVGLSNGGCPITDTRVLYQALAYAASQDLTVFLEPLEPWLGQGHAHDGPVAARLGLAGIPVAAETAGLARLLSLVEDIGVRLHLCRLSSARGVEMLRAARQRGLPVTADVAVHHLHLCEVDVGRFDSACHVLPPLRGIRDRDALRLAVADGTISSICSDHQPHDQDAKERPFAETAPGISGLDTLLGLTLKLAEQGLLSIGEALARVTSGPSQVLGVPQGSLLVGAPADICLLDPDTEWEPSNATLRSQGRNTPFMGWALPGQVLTTIIAGRIR